MLADINDWFTLTGRLHPLIVHLPIGIVMLAVLFEGLSYFKRFGYMRPSLPFMWLSAAVTAVFACVAGFVLASDGGYETNELLTHQWLGIAVAVLTIACYLIKMFAPRKNALGLISAFASVVMLSLAGHYGGALTHGEEFLNEPLYGALGIKPDEQKVKTVRKPIANIEEAIAYQDLIEPVLEQKCYKCHNASKQKGDLRLDGYKHIAEGGENGAVIVAGNPQKSELYARLVLPVDDKKRMPPKGKSQLTKEEIELIHWWIKEGEASADKKVAQIAKPEPIKVMLAGYSSAKPGVANTREESELPSIKVAEATPEQLKALEEIGIVINRLSSLSPFVSVNCVNVATLNDKQSEVLLNVKSQAVWLRLGSTQITDVTMNSVTQMPNLTRLGLEYTAVTDKGMASLQKLTHLQYLNLVGTKVTDGAIQSLAKCKKLKAVYLWQTSVTRAGAEQLRKALPETEINIGDSNVSQ